MTWSTLHRGFWRREKTSKGDRPFDRPIVFVHIPKTAGTSFFRYLESNIPAACIAPPFLGDLNKIQISDASKKLFWGHFRFIDIYRKLPDAMYVTFLRDPLARSYSQYNSWHDPRNFPSDDPWRKVMTPDEIDDVEFAQSVNFEEFVTSPRQRFVDQLKDVQTYMLSSEEPGSPQFLRSAKENLGKLTFFGLVEEFDRSIQKLQQLVPDFGPYRLSRDRENRSREEEMSLSRKGRERLLEMIHNDSHLYRYAVGLF
ncbi:sulfotransferase family 2 domain-containing protein [Mesorhizobium sp. NZP2077]|uniref:sulfotransferase family 2 domain-containing protein n=1 Tax=Mesorhizobium sp. NZP2077 TaxID=2483404 RepID=UPI001553D804|nr:sulfotransferase family 2 domain-containing protein [Mesorhizobium sp. NZP2077]QKC84852.1 hypothetical protein EB232_27665 [Mesorhizobium sp. NZP2077]QKD18457.1 sulfotransferase family protein [Mesorhizobium sp. NZP2077]